MELKFMYDNIATSMSLYQTTPTSLPGLTIFVMIKLFLSQSIHFIFSHGLAFVLSFCCVDAISYCERDILRSAFYV